MTESILQVSNLVKQFGGVLATDYLNFEMWSGEIHAVIGPNGAGKTTFVSQIAGMLRPDAGCIRFAGVIRSDVQRFTCRSKVWYAGRTYGHDSG